ncbi:MAG: hypothetical protein GX539_13655 [Candidatus Cloacimonetes bacterium]|jgi:hypothetical protein|nr:hypothetical protein [Candidatus Cloacimonadota bacterium]
MHLMRTLAAAALLVSAAGCSDVLEVTNPNDPDRERILARPSDVEGLASSQFQQIISATLGSIARVQTGMMTASFENASGLANNGLGPRSGIPRQPIDNNRGNAYQAENFNDFRLLSSVARNSADILARAKADDFALPTGNADLVRLKAWTHFTYGVALGYLSLVYDSAGVPRPDDDPSAVPPLESYSAVNQWALMQFDSAIAYANAGMSSLPSGWLTGPGGASVSAADFVRVVRSFKARMRAGVARDPAERAAVDWNAVIDDATNGIQADFNITYDPSNGWDHAWMATTLHFRDANWHQMTYYIIGMADTTGAFDAWLATPRSARVPFLIRTPDERFPSGNTRADQNANMGKYFRNRDPGGDQAGTGWQNSQYDHYRFRAWADAARNGEKPFFTKAENDMLAAEGYIRTGNIPAAAALIDNTRTANGLPALSGAVANATDPVPGGNACVPRVPVGPNFTTTACGNIMEAMKWEKRMETAYTTYGGWFFDGRGWGDLPIGTPVQWPVPVDELDARIIPPYNMGGVGLPGGAGSSTYGYGEGDR